MLCWYIFHNWRQSAIGNYYDFIPPMYNKSTILQERWIWRIFEGCLIHRVLGSLLRDPRAWGADLLAGGSGTWRFLGRFFLRRFPLRHLTHLFENLLKLVFVNFFQIVVHMVYLRYKILYLDYIALRTFFLNFWLFSYKIFYMFELQPLSVELELELLIFKIGAYTCDDFFGFRKAILFKLRKYQLVVNEDIETMKFSRF